MTKRTNISVSSDTLDRLDEYAKENHFNRSQAITQLVWQAKVKNPQARGQMTMDDFARSTGTRKKQSRPDLFELGRTNNARNRAESE